MRIGISKQAIVIALAVLLIGSLLLSQGSRIQNIIFGNEVAVIPLNTIINEASRERVTTLIDLARTNETVKAVVLKIDSPGGYVADTQEIYESVLRLKTVKPVVASIIGLGASGAYYVALAANYIYVLPGSIIGNVGIIGFPPGRATPGEGAIESGPYKLTGASVIDFQFELQSMLKEFLNAVQTQRGDRLKIDITEVAKGSIYFGKEAVELGLADELGGSEEAADRAARLAGLHTYSTISLSLNDFSGLEEAIGNTLTMKELASLVTPPAFYYIYVPDQSAQNLEPGYQPWRGNATTPVTIGALSGDVLIDFSHNNRFARSELTLLEWEIVSRGYSVGFVTDPKNLTYTLPKARLYIVINPGTAFIANEIELVRELVSRGGGLLLISDPARVDMDAINTLSSSFGIIFANGYLYNLQENYANYRNIVVTDFAQSNVTRGIHRLVFFTATYVLSNNGELTFTSNNTYSSGSERQGEYSPIVALNGTKLVAVGDETFLTQPYCYTGDDYQLMKNIVQYLLG